MPPHQPSFRLCASQCLDKLSRHTQFVLFADGARRRAWNPSGENRRECEFHLGSMTVAYMLRYSHRTNPPDSTSCRLIGSRRSPPYR